MHRAEQDIGLAQRTLHRMKEDDTVILNAIEAKPKDIEALRSRVQLAGIKVWQETRGLLTREQLDRLRATYAVPPIPDCRQFDYRTTGKQRGANNWTRLAVKARGQGPFSLGSGSVSPDDPPGAARQSPGRRGAQTPPGSP